MTATRADARSHSSRETPAGMDELAPSSDRTSRYWAPLCTAWSAGLDGLLGTTDDVCTSVDQIPLFSNNTLAYLWSYDNEGLKVAQLRFYEVPTTPTF